MTSEDSNRSSDDFAPAQWAGAALCAFLLVVAAIQEGGAIGAAVANGLSLVSILVGVAWTVRGAEKLRRFCELYLWLAFVLSVSLLKVLSDGLARRTGMGELATFRAVAVAHLLIVVAALWALGAWSRRDGRAGAHSDVTRLAAGLLIAGAVVFWVGARTFPGMSLEAVSANLGGHLWTSGNFALATLITLVGLGLLTLALRDEGDRVLSVLGFYSFMFGAVFWILHLAFRWTIIRAAAEEYGRTASPPPWFEPWRDWAGLLFGIFSVLAYLGIAAYGGALLRTGLVARWVGWTCVVGGLAAAPLFGPPLFIHVLLWLVGLLVVRR